MQRQGAAVISVPSSLKTAATGKELDEWRARSQIDRREILEYFEGDYLKPRERLLKFLTNEFDLRPRALQGESRKEEVKQTTLLQQQLFKAYTQAFNPEQYYQDAYLFQSGSNLLFPINQDVAVKMGVNFTLFYMTLRTLGTEKHQHFIQQTMLRRLIGCFALTEMGHGSNVREIQTEATYDKASESFIINTPCLEATKWWIGGAAKTSNIATVFAQLIVDGNNHGVQAFIVPLRDTNHDPLPGVTIGDCGPKPGLNGIDNGFLQFKEVRIPRDNMLDKVLAIEKDGTVVTSIDNANTRFAISLGALSTGRVVISGATMRILLNSLTVAIRYAAQRRQFGSSKKEENFILDYPLQQFRLMPLLAMVFACNTASREVVSWWKEMRDLLFDPKNKRLTEVHAVISCFKAVCTWYSFRGVQECREACGGHGYNALSLIGVWRNDTDINQTWEGDNNVLLQQTSKYIADCGQKLYKGKKLKSELMQFLCIEPLDEAKAKLGDADLFMDPAQFAKVGDAVVKAFEWRVNYLLQTGGMKIASKIGDMKPLDAWNDTQPFYLRELGIAFAEMLIVKMHYKNVRAFAFKDAKNKDFCLLNAFMWILKDAALFRQNDFITSDEIKDIKQAILGFLRRSKDHLVAVIDAIALPDHLIGSPLGARDGHVYEKYFAEVERQKGVYEKAEWIEEMKAIAKQYSPKL